MRRISSLVLRGARSAPLLALALALAFTRGAAAQATGTIAGHVTQAGSADPVAGAAVVLVGTALGTATDARGGYSLSGLLPGEYRVEVTSLGREPHSESVAVRAGETTRLDVVLEEGSVLLPGIVVSATRAPERAGRVAATVNVLSPEEVRRSPARAPDDLLRELPGLELPRTSGTVAGAEQILSIRGTDEGRTLVLLDNVPLNDPWGEWIVWQRAPVWSLDRVEVTEGGGSSLYGNYAMGGVVQLVSRPIAPRTLRVMGSAGSRDLKEGALFASDVFGRIAASVDGGISDGGGYVLVPEAARGPVDIGNSSTRRNANVRAAVALGPDRTLDARASYLDEDRTLGTEGTPNSRTVAGFSLGANLGDVGAGRLTGALFGNRQTQDSHQSRVAPNRTSETPALLQEIPSHDVGGSLQWSRPAGTATVSVGGDFRYMYGRLDETVYGATGAVTRTASSGGNQLIGGVFLQGVLAPAERLRIELSGRVDGWRNADGFRETSDSGRVAFDDKTSAAFSPRIGVRYDLAPGLTLRGSAFRSFRAPSLSEQYRTFIAGTNTFTPNPQLGPEYLTGGDVGLDWRPAPEFELRFTVFDNEMRDLSSFTFLKPGFLVRRSVGKAHARGVEGEVAIRPIDALAFTASYNYDDAKTDAGARIARVPLQRFVAKAMYADPRTADLSLIYRHEGVMNALSGQPLPRFDVVDLDARRTFARWGTIFVSVENLADAEYVVNKSGPLDQIGLPRTIRAGLVLSGW